MAGTRRRGRAAQAAEAASAHLRRSERWNGLGPGEPVEVALPWGRAGQWRFVAHVRNERNGAEWVEVSGGRRGDERRRACRPEEVLPAGGRRRGSPSVADAPRLPFD